MTRIVCQQLAPTVGDLAGNQALSSDAVRQAVDAGADVVVLPELVTSGYVFASADEAASVAITPEHPIFSEWAAHAATRDSIVVGGFCEQGDDGSLYNSAALVDHTGVRAVYRKCHLWDREKLVFRPGTELPPVIDTHAGRVGMLICYDLEFPEMPRTLAIHGADLIAVPTNWPRVRHPSGDRPPEVVVAMAAARTNRVFIACCDRTGTERGQEWMAGTSLIDEFGWVAATPTASGAATADVDLARARNKKWTALSDVLGDRRPRLYSSLVEPDKG